MLLPHLGTMASRRSSKVAARDCFMVSVFILLTFRRFGSFPPCSRLYALPEFCDEALVCPALSSANDLSDTNMLPVPLPDYDIVDEMPVLRTGMHPRRPVTGREAEDSVISRSGGVVDRCSCNCQLHASQSHIPRRCCHSLLSR